MFAETNTKMTREQLGQIVTVEDLLNLKLEIFSALDSNKQVMSSLRTELQQAGVVPPEKLHYSPKEFAAQVGITVRTVNNWIHDGIIEASQPNGFGGAWLIPLSEVKRISEGGSPGRRSN